MRTLLEILGQYGLPIVLVVYFVWRDYERDKQRVAEKDKLTAQIDELHKEIRSILTKLVSETTAIIVANSESMRDWLEILKIRPCLADELAKKLFNQTEELLKQAKKHRLDED